MVAGSGASLGGTEGVGASEGLGADACFGDVGCFLGTKRAWTVNFDVQTDEKQTHQRWPPNLMIYADYWSSMTKPSILRRLPMRRARKLSGYVVQMVEDWSLLVNASICEVGHAQTGGT